MSALDKALRDYQETILSLLDESFPLSKNEVKKTPSINKIPKIALESPISESFLSTAKVDDSQAIDTKVQALNMKVVENVRVDQAVVVVDIPRIEPSSLQGTQKIISLTTRSKSKKVNVLKWIGGVTILSVFACLLIYFAVYRLIM